MVLPLEDQHGGQNFASLVSGLGISAGNLDSRTQLEIGAWNLTHEAFLAPWIGLQVESTGLGLNTSSFSITVVISGQKITITLNSLFKMVKTKTWQF